MIILVGNCFYVGECYARLKKKIIRYVRMDENKKERKRNCCDAIPELSKTNQTLFFTCHPDIVQIMQDKSPELKVIDLESI
jgi:hypothetical protein